MRLSSTVAVAAALMPSTLAANNTGKYPYSPTNTRAATVPVTPSVVNLAHTHASVKTLNESTKTDSNRAIPKESDFVKTTDVFRAQKMMPSSFDTRNYSHSPSTVRGSITTPTGSEHTAASETVTKTVVSTISSCPASVSDCTVGSVVTTVVPAVASKIISITKPTTVSLSVVAQASITVVVPDRFVIVGGGAVYFPGLCDACGHYRVVFKNAGLLEYHIEACTSEERNTAIVPVNGQYRYLACSGKECRKMIVGEGGASHVVACAGNECEKNLVCPHGQQCEFAACTGECFQVKICDKVKCDVPARPALPPAPTGVHGGPVINDHVPAATKAKVAISSQGRVTGLVSAAASAKCIKKGPEAGPAHPAVPAGAPLPSSGSGSKGAPATNHKETAASGVKEAPKSAGSGPEGALVGPPASYQKEAMAPGVKEAPVPGRKEGPGAAPKIADEVSTAPQKAAQAPASASAAAKAVTSEPNAPKTQTQASASEAKPAGSQTHDNVPQSPSKPQDLGSKIEQPRPVTAAAGKLAVGCTLVGALVGLALVI